jgi:hypothetical protein
MRRTVVAGIVAAAVVGLGALGVVAGTTAQPAGTGSVQAAQDMFLEIKGIKGG